MNPRLLRCERFQYASPICGFARELAPDLRKHASTVRVRDHRFSSSRGLFADHRPPSPAPPKVLSNETCILSLPSMRGLRTDRWCAVSSTAHGVAPRGAKHDVRFVTEGDTNPRYTRPQGGLARRRMTAIMRSTTPGTTPGTTPARRSVRVCNWRGCSKDHGATAAGTLARVLEPALYGCPLGRGCRSFCDTQRR